MSSWKKLSEEVPEKEGIYLAVEYSEEDMERFRTGKIVLSEDCIRTPSWVIGKGFFWDLEGDHPYLLKYVTYWCKIPEYKET